MAVSCRSLPWDSRLDLSSHRAFGMSTGSSLTPRSLRLIQFPCGASTCTVLRTFRCSRRYVTFACCLHDQIPQVQNFATLLSVGLLFIIFTSQEWMMSNENEEDVYNYLLFKKRSWGLCLPTRTDYIKKYLLHNEELLYDGLVKLTKSTVFLTSSLLVYFCVYILVYLTLGFRLLF